MRAVKNTAACSSEEKAWECHLRIPAVLLIPAASYRVFWLFHIIVVFGWKW